MIKDVITISAGEWQAQVCPRLGGNIVKLTWCGEDVLCPLSNEEQLKVNPYLQGAPILMPANRTEGGRFAFEGKEFFLPLNEPHNNCNLHGSVLYENFEVVKADSERVVLFLSDRNGKSYPFPFEMTVTYKVSKEGLSSVYEIENAGSGNMPLTFCLHTTFVEPDSFAVPIDLCQEKDEHHIPTGRYVDLAGNERDYPTGSASLGRVISGYYRACGRSARVGKYLYEVSDNFDHWILFNGRGESGLLCVEPQSGKVNGLNMPDGYIVLSSNEKITFITNIKKLD